MVGQVLSDFRASASPRRSRGRPAARGRRRRTASIAGAVYRTAAQHHFTAGPDNAARAELLEFDTDGSRSVEDHRVAVAPVSSVRLGRTQRRFEVGVGGAPPSALALSNSSLAKSFRRSTVLGDVNPIAALPRRL